MSGQRAPWSSPDDYLALSVAIIVFCLALGLFGAWHFYHTMISYYFALFAHYEIGVLRHFTSDLDPLDRIIVHADYSLVTLGEMVSVLGAIGGAIRAPAVTLIALLAVPCFLYAAPSQFTRKFDLTGLIRELADHFPTLGAFADRELRLVPLDKSKLRPADPALTASEWVDRFARDSKGRFNPHAAEQAFIRQLGPLWGQPEDASPIVRVLFAAFSLHLAGKRKEAMQLLGDLSSKLRRAGNLGEKGPDRPLSVPADVLAEADKLLTDPELTRSPRAIGARHAFAHPALMSLLISARRRSGVLAPAAFLVTKLIDRPLWYALHALGYPSDGPGQNMHPNPRIEAAGARCHWSAECLAGGPLRIPVVQAAIDAGRTALPQTDVSHQDP
jgi:intracellular multiplication protein IcmP